MGADLLDKNQSHLTSKSVRAASALPLVAVDLYGDRCDVSYFPPMEKDEGKADDDEMAQMMRMAARIQRGVRAASAGP
ncbi:hypothetical protein THAOC_27725, partial [Thalassiosira oceanica]